MKITHIAVWTSQLERLKDFYITYFGASAGKKYVNTQRQFSSYFLKFQGDTSLELMSLPGVNVRPYDKSETPVGLTHLAFCVNSKEAVDALTARLQADGYEIEKTPRMTGDGFYESAIFDPDGNIVEITC